MVSTKIAQNVVVGAAIIAAIIVIIILIVLLTRRSVPRTGTNCPKLNPPNSFTLTAGPEMPFKLLVSWNAVPGATTYVVYRKSNPGVTKNSFTDKKFTTSTHVTFDPVIFPTQYVRISVFNDCGEGELSTEQFTNVECRTVPPKNLDVQTVNASTVQATWDPIPNAVGYHLYVNNVEVFSGNMTSVNFSTPTPGDYKVQVSTQNVCGEGPKSDSFNYDAPLIFI